MGGSFGLSLFLFLHEAKKKRNGIYECYEYMTRDKKEDSFLSPSQLFFSFFHELCVTFFWFLADIALPFFFGSPRPESCYKYLYVFGIYRCW
jgi:IS4 transposase